MSGRLVFWVGLAWSVARLFRLAAVGRLHRVPSRVLPPDFAWNVSLYALAACFFGTLLITLARPLVLAGFWIVIGVFVFDIHRGTKPVEYGP